MQPYSSSSEKLIDSGVHAGLFLFFTAILSTRSIYTIGAGLLLATCLIKCIRPTSSPVATPPSYHVLSVILSLIFMNGIAIWLYHDNAVRQLDLLSRYVLMIPLLYALSRTQLQSSWIISSFAIGSLSSLWLVYQQLGGEAYDGRVYGYTGAIQFGNIALLLGLFCLSGLISQWRAQALDRLSILYACGAAAGFFASLASGSRGGWIAAPLALVVIIVGYTPRRYALRCIITCTIIAGVSGILLSQSTFIQQRYDLAAQDIAQYEAGNTNTSIGARLAIWQANWQLIKQSPLLGWSQAGHAQALEQTVRDNQSSNVVLNLANSHNNYIESWVYLGISGLILLLSLLIYCFFQFIKHIRHENPISQQAAINGSILILVYFIANFTQNMMERNNTLLFFLITLATFWSLLKNKDDLPSDPLTIAQRA